MTFNEMGLAPSFSDRLAKQGITEPTSIQAEVFNPIITGQSVLGLSKTGTGKTLAFLSPMVQRFSSTPVEGVPFIRGIVLVPTRELATQVARDLEVLAAGDQRGVVIVGGEAEDRQIQESRNTTWLIATPGRLLDLLKRRQLDVSRAEAVIFDEADRILDMGFVDDIRAIMKFVPKGVQLLFFSATLHFGVDEMAYEFGAECFRFGQEEEQLTVEGLHHKISFIGDDEKFHALVWFIASQGDTRGIIFSNYRERAHEISSRLNGLGCEAASLTAQLSQAVRSKIMEEFRSGKVQVLVASDLASRGLDVFDIDWVVNYDLSEDPAIYVHRVGRTARAGRKGNALSFVGFEDSFRLERLEKFLGKPIERAQIPLEALQGRLKRFKPAPELPQGPSGGHSHSHSHERRPQERPRHQEFRSHPKPNHPHQQPQGGARPASSLPAQVRPALAWHQKLINFVLGIFGKAPKKSVSTAVAVSAVAGGGAPSAGRTRDGGPRRGGRGGHKRSGPGFRSGSSSSSSSSRRPSSSRGRR